MEAVKKRFPKIQKESRKTKEKKADLSNPINLLVKSAGDFDTVAPPYRTGGCKFSVVWVRVTRGVQVVREGGATYRIFTNQAGADLLYMRTSSVR